MISMITMSTITITMEITSTTNSIPFKSKSKQTSDYLRKHLLTRHETFASELQLQDAEPFMRTRYESEDIASRPLPPIEVSILTKIAYKKSNVLKKHSNSPFPPLVLGQRSTSLSLFSVTFEFFTKI